MDMTLRWFGEGVDSVSLEQIRQIPHGQEVHRVVPVIGQHHPLLLVHTAEHLAQEIVLVDPVRQVRKPQDYRAHLHLLREHDIYRG